MTSGDVAPPQVTAKDAVDDIVRKSRRKRSFPLRRDFVQQRNPSGKPSPGPLAGLVAAGDKRGLLLYLLLVTKASAEPWNAALPSAAWARALGHELPNSKSARTMVSKIWLRLERHGLVRRERRDRLADVFLLREDGGKGAYTSPGSDRGPYLRVPLDLWVGGPDTENRWYQLLTLPELALILIGRSLGDGFLLPQEKAVQWYGISADTIGRGVAALTAKGLLSAEKTFKIAPLSAVGYTEENRYTLLPPFGPVGHVSGSGTRKQRKVRSKAASKVRGRTALRTAMSSTD
ncbi:MAG: hypothetical protein QOG43_387 [Actinomycetota bacterium]|jgi:hypothetical protein|nr:hypothetical protein [Actinomycetota bacterium]